MLLSKSAHKLSSLIILNYRLKDVVAITRKVFYKYKNIFIIKLLVKHWEIRDIFQKKIRSIFN